MGTWVVRETGLCARLLNRPHLSHPHWRLIRNGETALGKEQTKRVVF